MRGEEEAEEEEEKKEASLVPVTGSAESAALRLRAPLQQEQAQRPPAWQASTWILTALTLQTVR